jgi:hypothetical protein
VLKNVLFGSVNPLTLPYAFAICLLRVSSALKASDVVLHTASVSLFKSWFRLAVDATNYGPIVLSLAVTFRGTLSFTFSSVFWLNMVWFSFSWPISSLETLLLLKTYIYSVVWFPGLID